MDKHTPTPWNVDREAGDDSHVMIDSQSDVYIGEIFIEANAAFIVRAVNSHEALLGFLKTLSVRISETREPCLYEAAQKAIAKAEGR